MKFHFFEHSGAEESSRAFESLEDAVQYADYEWMALPWRCKQRYMNDLSFFGVLEEHPDGYTVVYDLAGQWTE